MAMMGWRISLCFVLMNLVSFGIGYCWNESNLMILSGSAILVFSFITFLDLWNSNYSCTKH